MNISEISIKNHVFAWMLMAGLVIFGAMAFNRMGISQLPDVNYPNVSINARLDGAAPEVLEQTVVDLIEGALTSIPGIVSMTSNSQTGSANISVEFSLDKNIDVGIQEIQSALGRVQRRLPNGVEPPSVSKSNPDDDPIIWLTVTAEASVTADSMATTDLMALVRDQIQDRFTNIDGVGEVTLGGYIEPNLRVWLDIDKLTKFELTPSDIVSAIQREHSEKPGGKIETQDKELNIRLLGEATNLSEFKKIAVARRGGGLNYQPTVLKDVAQIEDGLADVRSYSRSQGKKAIGLGIKKQPGSNAVDVADRIKARVKELSSQLPKGVELAIRFDMTQFIREAVHELHFTLILSAVLTALVCWLFLGSWTATLNVILAIPTSVIGTFIVLNFLGYTLNTFTLLGLSLAIGIVVDDAIMVLENIVRKLEHSYKSNPTGDHKGNRLQAALEGSREIILAALAATAAIIAIFLPVAFMDGVIGKYFMQFGTTLSVAVTLSLLEALTLTPMRCSRFLTIEPRTTAVGRFVENVFIQAAKLYAFVLPHLLKHNVLVVCGALTFFAFTLFLGRYIKQEFIPTQDQGRLAIRLQTPVGSSLALTDLKMKELETYLLSRPEVDSYFSNVGGQDSNSGFIALTLKPRDQRKLSAQELSNEFRKDFKNIKQARIVIMDPSQAILGGRRSSPVAFSLRGPDWQKLVEYSKLITEEMQASPTMVDVDSNYKDGLMEVQVLPDRKWAQEYGVDMVQISDAVNTLFAGVVVAKFSQDSRRYDVRLSLPASKRTSADIIKKINVRNNRGEMVPLSKVVQIQEKQSLQSITREDRQRAITVRANVAPKSSQAEAIAAAQAITKKILPDGYYAVISGSSKVFQDSFSSLYFALIFGVLVSYMVLASQFNSFLHPFTILVALPFSLSGAFIALLITHQTLNIFSLIGLILLMGIVKKNSILLVDFTNQFKAKGHSVNDALTLACPIRLRPILMTSFATLAGALPPAFALGPGAEARVPMAIAVIGGVLFSTILTLFVVPSVYSLLDRFDF